MIWEGIYFSPPRVTNLISARHNLVLTLNVSHAISDIQHIRRAVSDSILAAPKEHPFASHYVNQLRVLQETIKLKEDDLLAFVESSKEAQIKETRKKKEPP